MTNSVQVQKVLGGVALAVLWVCCFLFISPTLFIDFGANILVNLKLTAIVVGLLIIVLYHIYYRSNAETTKLSLTAALTVLWVALIFFYPFTTPVKEVGKDYSGAVGFFTLVGGLAVCILWVRFFADEVV